MLGFNIRFTAVEFREVSQKVLNAMNDFEDG